MDYRHETSGSHVFSGTARFRVIRQIGSGGMGVVYEAYDQEREERVALKTLHPEKPRSLRFLKKEFRALAEIRHRNLVRLHELIEEEGHWFYTMELIQGDNWLKYVKPRMYEKRETEITQRGDITPNFQPGRGGLFNPFHEERLRDSLRQLVSGLCAIHQAGKLHCDVKPSNVLVTAKGRVVLLDFGLVTTRDATQQEEFAIRSAIGTPAYMSPEQALGHPLSPASDLYSVGVFLFRGLTGILPFRGPPQHMIKSKTQIEARPASRINRNIPADLDELCTELLARRPSDRPLGRDVMSRLNTVSLENELIEQTSEHLSDQLPKLLVGRDQQLEILHRAFIQTKGGRPVMVVVEGPSGIGKTWLVERFLDEIMRQKSALVLRSRCHEQESVSYKAFDAAMDDLTRYLAVQEPSDRTSLVPQKARTLARLFPVLMEIDAVQSDQTMAHDLLDPFEQRRTAFLALKELLRRLNIRQRVIIAIDDLQRSDHDSLSLLQFIMSSPGAPPLLLIATSRPDDGKSKRRLSAVMRALEADSSLTVKRLSLKPLPETSGQELAEKLLSKTGVNGDLSAFSRAVARQAEGNPFFIEQLVHHTVYSKLRGAIDPTIPDHGELKEVSLQEVIEARLDHLNEAQRRLLETIAVAEYPTPRSICANAAAMEQNDIGVLETLRDEHLIRVSGLSQRDEVVVYHDRIREVVLDGLSAEALQIRHLSLAHTIEADQEADAERLAVHFTRGGKPEQGCRFALTAADEAAEALAFDRAARLYQLVLDLSAENQTHQAQRVELTQKLGDALANAGRSAQAAQAYLDAALLQSGNIYGKNHDQHLLGIAELEQRAAAQLLRSGHVDEGLKLLRRVLGRFGLKIAASPVQAALALAAQRARIRLRGYGYKHRTSKEISKETLMLLDSLWSAGLGLAQIDPIRAGEFQARYVLLALDTGEPHRLARALAFEAAYIGTVSYKNRSKCYQLIAEATLVGERYDNPISLGAANLADGVTSYMFGRWRLARRFCERAEKLFREKCVGVAWEINFAQIYTLFSLFFLGELRELARRQPELLAQARDRNDLLASLAFQAATGYPVQLAADQPDQVRRDVKEVLSQWSRKGFHIEHWWVLVARTQADLYEGRPTVAWQRLKRHWPNIRGSFLFRMSMVDMHTSYLRGLTALGAAMESRNTSDRQALYHEGLRMAQRLQNTGTPLSRCMALALNAGLAAQRGEIGKSASLLVQVEKAADSLDMPLYAAAAQHRRGLLLGGEQGAHLIQSAIDIMSQKGAANPEKFIEMIAPGWTFAADQQQDPL